MVAATGAGGCGVDHMATDTSIAQQLPGDCQERVCDGDGAVTTRPDNLDPPTSANPCTTGQCLNGESTFMANAAGLSCGPMMVCDGEGHCVGRVAATDCPTGTDPDCQAAICVANTLELSLQPPAGGSSREDGDDAHGVRHSGYHDRRQSHPAAA